MNTSPSHAAIASARRRRITFSSKGTPSITLIWATNWTVMKVALTYADPFVFNAQRTLIANRQLRHPLYWSPFLLINDWL